MAIYRLIAKGSFGPEEIEAMTTAYEAALLDLGLVNRDDPITEIVATAIVGIASMGERDPTALHYTFPTVRSFRGCLSSESEATVPSTPPFGWRFESSRAHHAVLHKRRFPSETESRPQQKASKPHTNT
jgi:hypothetical protein